MIAALVFDHLATANLSSLSVSLEAAAGESTLIPFVDLTLAKLMGQMESHFGNPIIPTLFKNLSKCETLFRGTKAAVPAA